MRGKTESGIALISTLLILVLLGLLLEGFILSVNSDQELIGIDRGQNQAFYGSLAGLEKLTADLGSLFETNYMPTIGQINALTVNPPNIPNISYVGGTGYHIDIPLDANGNPKKETRTIPSGPYEGLVGLITPYTMTVTSRTLGDGSEARMQRSLQTIAVPVFQFGIFSETDLSFFAGPTFNFGGRVHTNGNLFLAEGDGNQLTLGDRVTVVGEVVRTNLSNGHDTLNSYTGTVKIKTAGDPRALTRTEGSLVGTIGSGLNAGWTDLSIITYGGNILNGRTGARRMQLPIAQQGATPIGIIQRPLQNEDVNNSVILEQRFFDTASLRILLSDNANAITSLPRVTGDNPIRLSGNLIGGQVIGESTGAAGSFKSADTTSLIDGFIKIEIQTGRHVWQDVTSEILQLGITGSDVCVAPYPNSIIRVQRIKDNPANCATVDRAQYWPNTLYDSREGALRGNVSKTEYNVYLGGVMHYIELDVNNLSRWFRGEIGASGTNAMHESGYAVYFSDRRTNANGLNQETGEYGFEDVINSADSNNGLPNGSLEAAEDVNGNDIFDNYGRTPRLPAGPINPLDAAATPITLVPALVARQNRPIFFRRALKLRNGATINLGANPDNIPWGLTVASENPVYIQGDYNVTGQSFNNAHVASAVIADAVTLLSNNWNDLRSFNCPHTTASTCNSGKQGRAATNTWYRLAVLAGKGRSFEHPAGRYQDFGTDGGVHNFLRFLENWGGQQLNYRGSIISLFYNRQALGTYKCGENDVVYSPPTRGYNFDSEFLNPNLLPPQTPMFRDINITGFTQMKMPNQ